VRTRTPATIITTTRTRTRTSRARATITTRTEPPMGRLENIIHRNRYPKGNRERMVWGIIFGAFVLIILGLMVFTDLGERPAEDPPPPSIGSQDHRVDDVKLRKPRP
jgi:hypothetical protein